MANDRRDRIGYRKQLGRYKLSYADLRALEKILWVYADAREMKLAGVSELPEGRTHMPRVAVDRYAFMGRYLPLHVKFGLGWYEIVFAGVSWIYREDSVKFLKERGYPKKTRYLELAAWPGIKVTFTPKTTTLYGQTHYATGKELMIMKRVLKDIELYLLKCRPAPFNTILLKAIE